MSLEKAKTALTELWQLNPPDNIKARLRIIARVLMPEVLNKQGRYKVSGGDLVHEIRYEDQDDANAEAALHGAIVTDLGVDA